MSRRNSRYDRYEDRWPAYVPVAERRRKAELEMAKLRKKGITVSPVKIEGRAIASTFWGKAWCDNLESYRDYENRLERGRTYVRNGSVVDLQLAPREVTATVSGSELYKVRVSIGEVAKAQWKSICADCAGGIDSLVELLQGRFAKGVMERICRQGTGLFPKPAEIRFSCSCPDHASMCKHVAAVLYGVGARLDVQPELLFRLRAVNENEMVADIGQALPASKHGPAAGKVLVSDDMAALFGLDMAGQEAAVAAVSASPAMAPAGAVNGAARGKPKQAKRKAAASGSKATGRQPTPVKPVARSTKGSNLPVAEPAKGSNLPAARSAKGSNLLAARSGKGSDVPLKAPGAVPVQPVRSKPALPRTITPGPVLPAKSARLSGRAVAVLVP
jgi:uncharacterized Zn finger protein